MRHDTGNARRGPSLLQDLPHDFCRKALLHVSAQGVTGCLYYANGQGYSLPNICARERSPLTVHGQLSWQHGKPSSHAYLRHWIALEVLTEGLEIARLSSGLVIDLFLFKDPSITSLSADQQLH